LNWDDWCLVLWWGWSLNEDDFVVFLSWSNWDILDWSDFLLLWWWNMNVAVKEN
jgi:hypothetical protein